MWVMYKQLAEYFETDFIANEKYIRPLFRAFQWANIALAGEVVVWLMILMRG
jgi:hypothetical protein